MPNWCDNCLTIEAPNQERLETILRTIKGKKGEGEHISFNKILPHPHVNLDQLISTPDGDQAFWYQWNTENWGVKWNAAETHLEQKDGKTYIRFDTAWDPPSEKLMARLSEMFPETTFTWNYHDGEYDSFYEGELVCKGGEVEETKYFSGNRYADGQHTWSIGFGYSDDHLPPLNEDVQYGHIEGILMQLGLVVVADSEEWASAEAAA